MSIRWINPFRGYAAYDREEGVSWHETLAEARADAEGRIAGWRAARDDGWDEDDVEEVCVLIEIEAAQKVDPEADYRVVDYRLAPVPELAALRDVLVERRRQVEAEGYTPEHDDRHGDGQLIEAAVAYARYAPEPRFVHPHSPPGCWPWEAGSWRPCDRRRGLVKAAALLLAEIERLDRAGER